MAAIAIAGVLLVVFVAMQINADVRWSLFDFVTAAILLFMLAAAFIFATKRLNRKQLAYTAIGLTVLGIYVWAELAVGVFFHFGS